MTDRVSLRASAAPPSVARHRSAPRSRSSPALEKGVTDGGELAVTVYNASASTQQQDQSLWSWERTRAAGLISACLPHAGLPAAARPSAPLLFHHFSARYASLNRDWRTDARRRAAAAKLLSQLRLLTGASTATQDTRSWERWLDLPPAVPSLKAHGVALCARLSSARARHAAKA